MNIFHQVTLQSLKKNRVRTFVTIIGVMLSAAMICAVTTTISSFQNYLKDNTIYTDGDWHGWVEATDFNTYTDILCDGETASGSYAQRIGYAYVDSSQNEYKPYLYILGVDSQYLETMPVHLTSGEYPTHESEILLPKHLYENGGVRYKIGDTLTLDIGDRMLDGHSMTQHNPCYTYDADGNEVKLDEELIIRETRTYTVVGLYERLPYALEEYTAPGYTAITYRDKETYDPYLYDVFFKMEDPKDVYSFLSDRELPVNTNNDLLMFSGAAMYGNYYRVLYSVAAIVILLIMFGSVSLIYNAFSISVSERTKQFGLLSSIGATKKQLRCMVLYEALVISAIGIPLGIFVGIGGIGVTLLFIGHKFTSLLGNPVSMRLCVSPLSVILACFIALITILLSAWIPSKRATRISAIEAIRQQQDIQNPRSSRPSRITYRVFGLPGVLAAKYYKRSRKKYRATVISLFMSVVLFISASAFSDYLTESAEGAFDPTRYDIVYYTSPEEISDLTSDTLLQTIQETEGVTAAVYMSSFSMNGYTDTQLLSDTAMSNADMLNISEEGERSSFIAKICYINDEAFRELAVQNGLHPDDYYQQENPKAIAIDRTQFFSYTQEQYQDVSYFTDPPSEISFSVPGGWVSAKIGAVLYEIPYYISNSSLSLTLIYPYSMKDASGISESSHLQYYILSDNHSISYKQIRESLVENMLDTNNLYDYAEQAESDRNLLTIIQVFAYGFIVLISLIAMANVFNTISTNISLRRREFAMLKSVGMTTRGFNRMMNYECLLYGTRALLLGLPTSLAITYLIYHSFNLGYAMKFRLPWLAILLAVFSVFAVVSVTMMYAMSKVQKENPIDALKNENL